MAICIVGVDCATKDNKVGLAKALIHGNTCQIVEAECGTTKGSIRDTIVKWHTNTNPKTPISLLALDAPLGWPEPLGAALISHQAGEPISEESNSLFRRETDKTIHLPDGRKPLEVGANLIARTAKSALDLLHELRNVTGESIPLAWEQGIPQRLSAIEVYPAATRFSLYSSITPSSNKIEDSQKRKIQDRQVVLQAISQTIDISAVSTKAQQSAHIFDAVLCVVAGIEFINQRCQAPTNMTLAQKEGWIWVKREHAPSTTSRNTMI